MSVDPPVVDKIKKLLRLGQSANQHEASLALERAFELASRYKIEVSSLDLDEATEQLVSEHFKIAAKASFLHRRAQSLLMSFFNVEVITAAGLLELIGSKTDVAIAWYVYGIVVREGNKGLSFFKASEKELGRAVTTNKSRSFVQGFIYGVAEQLKRRKESIELEDARFAIILHEQEKERAAFVEKLHPGIKTKKPVRVKQPQMTALLRGLIRGRETRIDKAVEDRSATTSSFVLTA